MPNCCLPSISQSAQNPQNSQSFWNQTGWHAKVVYLCCLNRMSSGRTLRRGLNLKEPPLQIHAIWKNDSFAISNKNHNRILPTNHSKQIVTGSSGLYLHQMSPKSILFCCTRRMYILHEVVFMKYSPAWTPATYDLWGTPTISQRNKKKLRMQQHLWTGVCRRK